MKITTDLMEAFLKCPTKCYLRANEEIETGNAYANWVRTQSDIFRREGIKRLVAAVPPGKCVEGGARMMVTGKSAQWNLATDFVGQTENLQCSCHGMERRLPAGRGRNAQFIPIRLVFTNKPTRDDKLLLAFDALVMSRVLKREVTVGRIVHGDDYVTLNVNTRALRSRVEKSINEISALISSPSPPDLVLNRHCAECGFQTRCRQKAFDKDDLNLLGSMTEKERTDFNRKGIFTVTQLSFTFRPRRRPKGLRNKRERYHHSLKALAIREKKLHIVGNPEIKIEGAPVYLDVEGLPDRGFYYLIGVRIRASDAVVQHSLWADSPSDEGRIWREFLSILTELEDPILIHYGSFESVFLKRMCAKHGGPPDGSRTAKAINSSVNLLSVMFAQIYFPTYSNGLKEIANWLGFNWSDQESSGVQSIVWRHQWEQTQMPSVKEKLITYNSEDCTALELVFRAILQACHKHVGSDMGCHLEVVVADKPDTKSTMWPRFSSSIQDLEAVNKAARWDYQRDHIYIRTDAELKRAKRKKNTVTKRAVHISKVVVCEQLSACPRCQRKGTQTFRTVTKCLHDVRFTRSGVAGWIVRYQFRVFWCPTCGAFTPWPKEFWDRTTYGRNLAAFAIFEIIQLCVSQRSVTETLNRLFGFQMGEIVVRRIKERGAEYYRETRRKILAQMVQGNVIHADETLIRLHGKTAYVWVFTTFREVAYFYSETREGNFAQNALDGFKGVLVSDFYAAYDSLPCPQQKCLLHLMRDLNDAVLDNPYDESVRAVVKAFAELIRKIVRTIDRRCPEFR